MKTSEAVPRRIKVQKKDPAGGLMYEYEGKVLRREKHSIVLEALFDRADMPFMDVVFNTGDVFIEYYYADRWYNIFAIMDREDGKIKGWYCNVGKPAIIEEDVVSYVDLALDLWVSTTGKQTILDEDEFEKLGLNEELKASALKGLDELKALFKNNNPPL
jgi:protein associated with RNAse G/E